MRGAVAAGHPLTAEAGAQVLAEGASAVDACIAAAFVSWVAESTLTGPGAGGFMLVHRHHIRLDLAAIANHPRQQRGILQEPHGRATLKQLE